MEELDLKKTKYFVTAIIILILLSVILIVHFNNKELVSGDVEKENITETTTTTTTMITETITTTKKIVKLDNEDIEKEELEEKVVYKSAVDEKNNLIYNYKLTEEISVNDIIVSTKLNVDSKLLVNNVIGLYDISLYDEDMNKKNVDNSLITIKIPIKDELIGYDEYKIVYINESNQITDEKFEVEVVDNYIEFNTTHLSIFGIVGVKKEIVEDKEEIFEEEKVIDLSNVQVSLNVNDMELNVTNVEASHILLSKNDEISVNVKNINYDYQMYYSLKNDDEIIDYKLFDSNILSDIKNGNKYTLTIKIVVDDVSKEYVIGNISVYDIVFVYDKDEEVKEEDPIGTIYNDDGTIYKNEDGTEYKYIESKINKDIVIDNVKKEEIYEEDKEEITNDIPDENTNSVESVIGESLDDKATIKVNGNIYLVEETDISSLELTGYLIIDTSENITFNKDYNDKLLTSNLYTITIRSKEFTLNGIKYRYDYVEDKLIIKKVEEVVEDENVSEVETDVTDTFTDIFADDGYKAVYYEDNLFIANSYE